MAFQLTLHHIHEYGVIISCLAEFSDYCECLPVLPKQYSLGPHLCHRNHRHLLRPPLNICAHSRLNMNEPNYERASRGAGLHVIVCYNMLICLIWWHLPASNGGNQLNIPLLHVIVLYEQCKCSSRIWCHKKIYINKVENKLT